MKYILLLLLFIQPVFASPNLKSIFQQVSIEYSVSADLLSQISWLESNHRINAKTKTSSARGLFQIIRSTEKWLKEICKIEGDIFDPLTNTRLGACYIKHNTKYLKHKLKRLPTNLELYLAHFYGASKAFLFLKQPTYRVVSQKLFKREIQANKNVFYDGSRLRTYGEVSGYFQTKLNKAKVL